MTVLQTMWDKAVIVRMRARGVFASGAVLACLLLVAAPGALGLDPDRRISQYGHTVWRIQDGAISPPTNIAQTTDGFLWITTAQGLMRFDGVRFVPWQPPQGQSLPGTHFSAVLGSRDGSLWIGTTRGLARWKNGQLRTYTDLEHPAGIAAIIEDDSGKIWATRYGSYAREAPLCSISEETLHCFGKKDGIPVGYGLGLTHDSEGNIWFGSKVLLRWRPGTPATTYFGEIAELAKSDGVIQVVLGPSGTAWASLDGTGPQLGVRQYSGGRWTSFAVPGFDGARVRSGALLVDRRGSLWVGTMNDGVYRISGGVADHYGASDGLSGNDAGNLFEDREGNIWVLTDGGLDMFRDTALISYTTRQGVSDSHFYSVMALRNGAVWIGTGDALNILRKQDGKPAIFDRRVSRQGVGPMLEDHSGVVWLGVDLALIRFQNGRFREIRAPGGQRFASLGGVSGIAEDSSGTIWVLSSSGQLFSIVGDKIKQASPNSELGQQKYLAADPNGGLWLGAPRGTVSYFRDGRLQTTSLSSPQGGVGIHALFVDSDNSLLVPTSQGLYRLNHGQVTLFSGDNGLPCPETFNVIRDNHGALWIYTRCGMVRIAEAEWAKWIESPHVAVSVMILDARDGAQAGTGGSYQPNSSKAPDGRLWFETGVSVQMLDPDRLYENPLPPPVHIEDVIADRKTYSPQNGLHLPALTRDLEIDYTALSLVVPQKVHFQYKLEGYDREWQDAGTRRQAFYSNLPPRNYTFRVKACNNSGLWNEAGASLDFFVAPAYYQTNWFRLSCVAVFIALLWGLHRWRVHHLKNQEKRMRDVVETIPALTFTTSSDGSCTFVNKPWTEYTGLSVEETSGAGWQHAIHPEDLVRHSEKWRTSVATGQLFEDEARFRRAVDGEYRWFLVRGVPLRDQHANILRWYGTLTDIEDRKRAEEALQVLSRDLQESKTKLEEAQRITHVGYWEWDILTGRVNWSDETYRIYGLQPQEGPMDIETVRERIHPEDREAVFRTAEDAILRGVRSDSEHRLVRPSGEVRTVYSLGDLKRDATGRPYQMFGTVQDITDRKRAEEALQQSQFHLAEGQRLAHMGSWAFDATGFTYWSAELFQIYGLDPHGKPPTVEEYLAFVHPEDRAFMKQGIAKMLEDHLAFDFTKRIVRPDGEIRQVRCVGIPVTQGGIFQGFLGTGMDVTEQERLTEELRLSEQYLSEGQRLAHMGSWAFNPSGFFEYWSQELFKIYGLDPQKGSPTLEEYLATVHPQDRDFMANTIKRMHAERMGCDVKKRIVRPDGEQRYIRCVGIPVLEGEVLKGFLGTAIDITEQELLNQELERRQAYLAEAQRLTQTGSWAINVRTDEHFWSEEMFRINEIDPKLKPAWSLILDRVHPDDRASLEQRKKMEFTQTGWADSVADLRIVLPDGKIKHLHTIAHPVMDASGQIVEVIGTTMDVTERKRVEDSLRQSESYLAEAQKLTHTGSWAWRLADRKAVHLSTEWYRIYDFDPAQGAPTWEEYFERLHPEDRPKLKNTIECAIMEKADYDVEFRVLLPNGMVKWLHTVGHPVLSDGGDLEQFAGSSTDITELKSAEQEREKLRQLEAELAHTNRVSTLGEMAASLAHEIKQPIAAAITSANSCIEWLAHEPPNLDRARAAAARIDKYGNRAAEIIDRIRSFYKKSPPQRELVDANGIIHEMFTLLEGEATRSSIAMRTDASAELPRIMADRVQLQQVFMNLMLNAIEAMKDSGGELTVKSGLQDGQLQFSVSDTGVGLPAEKIDQIFSAFFTTKPQGSGMGLAISRSIVESHGGQLWASANSGGGATFHFTLPIQVTESSPLVA
jgi:PAS domain S-box-containing protein